MKESDTVNGNVRVEEVYRQDTRESQRRASLKARKDSLTAHHVVPVVEEVALERNFSFLACLGLAFTLLNSWTAMSGSLSIVLPSGGSISMVWGLITSAIGTMMMCLSLAEVCHVFPMSGGQYDIMAPMRMRKAISFFTGWMATAGWIALGATAAAIGSAFMMNIVLLWFPDFEPQAWQTFLIYLAILTPGFLLNIFAIRFLPLFDKIAGTWSMVGIITVIITLLSCAKGNYQPPEKVFASWTNETGWPNGMAFILGLLQSVFGLTGFDAATHMIEEMSNPSLIAPQVMVSAVLMGTVTSWIFMVVLLFCLSDFADVLEAPTGALLTIYYQATRSKVGATCLIMFNFMSFIFVQQVLITVSSRMLLSLSRDRAMGHLSRPLAPVHPTLKVPIWCIIFCTAWAVVFGLINLGSPIAVNAILSSSVVLLQISYFVPILLVFLQGEDAFAGFNENVHWSLGRWRRPINFAALVFLLVTSVCFLFPPSIPVPSGSSMNWVILVVAVVFVLWGATWLIDGRKRYQGPSDLEERLAVSRSS